MTDISRNVVILTRVEFESINHEWFQKGVRRGRLEESCNPSHSKDRKLVRWIKFVLNALSYLGAR